MSSSVQNSLFCHLLALGLVGQGYWTWDLGLTIKIAWAGNKKGFQTNMDLYLWVLFFALKSNQSFFPGHDRVQQDADGLSRKMQEQDPEAAGNK